MEPLFDEAEDAVDIQVEGGATDGESVITVVGELDPHTAPELDDAVNGALEDGSNRILIDLAGVRFIDSSGLRVIIGGHQRCDTTGGELILRNPSEAATRLLQITGLDQHIAVEWSGESSPVKTNGPA